MELLIIGWKPLICCKDWHIEQLKAVQEALKESKEEVQRKDQELMESSQYLQKEREIKEEELKGLKQQYEDEVAGLNAKVYAAEDRVKHLQTSRELLIVTKEEELTHVNEKLKNASQELLTLQVSRYIQYSSVFHIATRIQTIAIQHSTFQCFHPGQS